MNVGKSRAAVSLALIGLISFAALDARADAGGGWEYVTTDNGVVVYRKTVEGSDVVAFKGITYANLPIGKILAVFSDPSQRKFWVDRYEEHKTFESGKFSETYWIHFGLPWPVSDRDYVLRAEGKANEEKRTFTVNIKSVTHKAKGEDDCCVRAVVHGTYYEFTALPGENKTKILVEVHTDPKGSLPSWLVNMIQKSWPAKTLNGLINHAAQSNMAPLPEFADWHQKKAPADATANAQPAQADKEATPPKETPPASETKQEAPKGEKAENATGGE
jgi:hypothetical protein